MVEYEFIDYKGLSMITIEKDLEEHYGINLKGKDLHKTNFYCDILEKNFQNELKNVEVKKLSKIKFEQSKEIEKKLLNDMILKIEQIMTNLKYYEDDLAVDIFMGLLKVDEDFRVEFRDDYKEVWDSEACNKSIDMERVRKYYPYIGKLSCDSVKFIPGGCQEYHDLMLKQGNIEIFDVEANTESLKRYAFPKTYKIYLELKDTPIYNLLLLEKTHGIGYTNQIFHYTKGITESLQLDSLQELIGLGAKINPMFLRKHIVEKSWTYLKLCEYSDASISNVKKMFEFVCDKINEIYQMALKFRWHICYVEYKQKNLLYDTKLYLETRWKKYFNIDEAYEKFIESEKLHDFRNIMSVNDCFFCWQEKDLSAADWLYRCDTICIQTGETTCKKINVGKPCNALGEKIKAETISRLGEKYLKYKYEKEAVDLYYETNSEIFDELYAKEVKQWESKDPKMSTKRLKPLHIYAMVHAEIVKKLNT